MPFRNSIIPRKLLDIQVLDDSTDETREVARACVERHARARPAGRPISIAPIAKATKRAPSKTD